MLFASCGLDERELLISARGKFQGGKKLMAECAIWWSPFFFTLEAREFMSDKLRQHYRGPSIGWRYQHWVIDDPYFTCLIFNLEPRSNSSHIQSISIHLTSIFKVCPVLVHSWLPPPRTKKPQSIVSYPLQKPLCESHIFTSFLSLIYFLCMNHLLFVKHKG